jgi:hypothetical protein
MEEDKEVKNIGYYKDIAEKSYKDTPMCVLIYIMELERSRTNNKKIGKAIIIVKLSFVAFGYFILGMLQGTLNPLDYSILTTIIFVVWTFTCLRVPVNITKEI